VENIVLCQNAEQNMQISKIKNLILESLIPSYCYGCGRAETYLCEDCFEVIDSLPHSVCPHCKAGLGMGKLRKDCRRQLNLNRVFSCADYRDTRIKKLINDLKYNYSFALSEPLAHFAYWWLARNEYLDVVQQNIDVIIPVPVHKSKLKKRGFNHAQKIAQHLGEALDIRAESNLLIKTTKTKPQVETENKQERQENIKGTFEVIYDTVDNSLAGKNILLIDDVVTTGSTLSECSKVLRQSSVKEVWALTMAQD